MKAGEEMVERWRRGAGDDGAGAGGTGGAPLNPLQGIGNGGSASRALLLGLVGVGGGKDREACGEETFDRREGGTRNRGSSNGISLPASRS